MKDYQSIPGQGNSGSRDWAAFLFRGEVLDKHKEYYLVKMDKEDFKRYNETRAQEENMRRIQGPIFRVYYENIRDLVENEMDNLLK